MWEGWVFWWVCTQLLGSLSVDGAVCLLVQLASLSISQSCTLTSHWSVTRKCTAHYYDLSLPRSYYLPPPLSPPYSLNFKLSLYLPLSCNHDFTTIRKIHHNAPPTKPSCCKSPRGHKFLTWSPIHGACVSEFTTFWRFRHHLSGTVAPYAVRSLVPAHAPPQAPCSTAMAAWHSR